MTDYKAEKAYIAVGLMILEKAFLCFFFPIVSICEQTKLVVQGCCHFRFNGHNWQDLCRALHNNVRALGLVISEKEIFHVFSILRQIMTPCGVAYMSPI